MAALAVFFALALSVRGAERQKLAAPGARPLQDPPGIHNLYALGTNVYSGSTPEGEAGFQALAELGVKTILSVDGARPDTELARKHGLRYVHLPHGYDGIGASLQLLLSKAGQELPGPIYVHCHHGLHRGPTAAAIVCMAKESWNPAQAEAWLHAAGTATNYGGLYKTVREFKKPSAAALASLPADFPEAAKVSGLVDAMVAIDTSWDHLKAVHAAGYSAPPSHPDIHPASEAVILWEHYREAQRLSDAGQRGADFVERLEKAEAEAKNAERLLRAFASDSSSADLRARLDRSFDAISTGCASCHKAHRDASRP